MILKQAVKKLAALAGYEIRKITPLSHLSDELLRRKRIIEYHGIDTVLDVGANSGQYADQMRTELGFSGKIVSFEPLSSAFRSLAANAENDPDWEAVNLALGDADMTQDINIAGNSYSSSLLEMLPAHLESAPQSEYVGTEAIEVRKLDTIFNDYCSSQNNIYLKIDSQGYESRILAGAKNVLQYIDTIQMELSLVPLYDGEMLFRDMCGLMEKEGYTLISIEPGFSDGQSEHLLQVDGIFRRL